MVCLVVLGRKGREGGQSDTFFCEGLQRRTEKEIIEKRSEKAEEIILGISKGEVFQGAEEQVQRS